MISGNLFKKHMTGRGSMSRTREERFRPLGVYASIGRFQVLGIDPQPELYSMRECDADSKRTAKKSAQRIKKYFLNLNFLIIIK